MTSLFTENYQVKLIVILCKNKVPGLIYYIKSEYFFVESLSWSCRFIVNYYKKYATTNIDKEILENAKTLAPETNNWSESSNNYFKLLLQYLNNEIDFTDEQYVVDTVIQFIRKRELAYFLNSESKLIEEGNWEQLYSDISKKTSQIISGFSDLDNVFTLNIFDELVSPPRIGTNFFVVDNCLGGLYNKELLLFLADTNVGKSFLLCWLGANIVRNKGRVLHITLEMSQSRTFSRYFISLLDPEDNFTSTDIRNLRDLSGEKLILLSTLLDREKELYSEFLRIVSFPTGSCEPNDITQLLYKWLPDVLIIDYVDLLKGPAKVTDSSIIRYNQSELLIELRAISSIFNIPVITATQANRKAAGKRIITSDMVSEDYGKIRIADNVISIGQSQDDMLRKEVIFYIMKARNTQKGLAYRYGLDFEKMQFSFRQQELLA